MLTDQLHWAIATGLGMAGVGATALALARWRVGRGPGAWQGAAAWSVSVALKVAVALPTQDGLERWLDARTGVLATPLFVAFQGLLTGVFEVGLVALLAWRARLGRAGFGEAVRFGVGFGAAEALCLGIAVAGAAAAALGGAWPPAAQDVVLRLVGGSTGLADVLWPMLERLSALAFHVLPVLLLVAGRRAGRPWLGFWAAFLLKSAVDGVAAGALLAWGPRLAPGPTAALELGLAAAAALSCLAVKSLRRAIEAPAAAPRRGPAALAGSAGEAA